MVFSKCFGVEHEITRKQWRLGPSDRVFADSTVVLSSSLWYGLKKLSTSPAKHCQLENKFKVYNAWKNKTYKYMTNGWFSSKPPMTTGGYLPILDSWIILVGEYPNEIPMRKTSCRKVSHDISHGKTRYDVGILDETIIVDQHQIPGWAHSKQPFRHSSHFLGEFFWSWNNDSSCSHDTLW